MGSADRRLGTFLLLFVATLILWTYTVNLRAPWFGVPSTQFHQVDLGKTVVYTKNWYREGAVSVRFGLFDDPDSVEFTAENERYHYASYPPGAFIPVYVVSRVLMREPTPVLVMRMALFYHLLIAFVLGATVFLLLDRRGLNRVQHFLLSAVPISTYLLLPITLYEHQNVWFPEQAVQLPFAFCLLLETVRDRRKERDASTRWLDLMLAMVVLWGALTDWLFVFLVFCLFVKRLALGDFGDSMKEKTRSIFWFAVAPATAAALFLVQMVVLGGIENTVGRFAVRTGMSSSGAPAGTFYQFFWEAKIMRAYGGVGLALLWLSLACAIVLVLASVISRVRGRAEYGRSSGAWLAFISIVPCFMCVYVLNDHCATPGHFFTALKFAIPLSIVPFVVLPFSVLRFVKAEQHRRAVCWVMTPVLLGACALYLYQIHPSYKTLFPDPMPAVVQVGEFIAQNTEYEDVVFSEHYEIRLRWDQVKMAYAMKRVYKVASIFDIAEKVSNLDDDYSVVILATQPEWTPRGYGIAGLIARHNDSSRHNNLALYKIAKNEFLDYYNGSFGGTLPDWDKAPEVLQNGGFELGRGGMANWSRNYWIPKTAAITEDSTVNPPEGKASLRVDIDSHSSMGILQRVRNLDPGALYELRGYIKTKNIVGGAFIEVKDMTTSDGAVLARSNRIIRTSDWQEVAATFTVPRECTVVGFMLRHGTLTSYEVQAGTVWYDGCSLKRLALPLAQSANTNPNDSQPSQ